MTAITGISEGRAYIEVTFSYRGGEYTAVVYNDDQKLLEPFGLVFLGSEFERLLPEREIPADFEDGRREPLIARGFSKDPEIVAAALALRELANSGQFKEGIDLAV